MAGKLRQNTAVTITIGQFINWADSKTPLYLALGGNDNFDPTKLICTLTKGAAQTILPLAKSFDADEINYIVTGDMEPDVAGLYVYDGVMAARRHYAKEGTNCNISWNTAMGFYGAWMLSNGEGSLWFNIATGPGYAPDGSYPVLNNAVGIAFVAPTHRKINLLADSQMSFELTAEDVDTCGRLVLSLNNAVEGSEVILEGKTFEFEVVPANVYDSLFVSGNMPVDTAAIATAILAASGFTSGGTTTVANVLKFLAAWIEGTWNLKEGTTDTWEVSDADSKNVPVLEAQLSRRENPYKVTSRL